MAVERRRGEEQRILGRSGCDRLDERLDRLLPVPVLAVDEPEVGGASPGEPERLTILFRALAGPFQRVAGAG